MSLYLYQNDQQIGPFTDEQVNQMLQAGTVTLATLGWKQGMAAWSPLSSLGLSPGETTAPPAPPPGKRGSPLGIISLGLGLISLVAWAVLLVAAGLAHNNGTGSQTFYVIVGVAFIGGIFINFMAMVLGVIGAFNGKSNTLAIIGACMNGFQLVALVALLAIGLVAKGAH